jgi:hypothetical protein
MKNSDLLKSIRAGLLGLSMAVLMSAIPVAAQNNNANNGSGGNTTTTRTQTSENRTADRREDRDDDRDWGWLGLLGLAGLLGLMPRKRVPVVHETREVREGTPPPTDRR